MARDVVAKPKARNNIPVMRLDHAAWRALKRKHKAHSKIHNAPCWLHAYGMCLYHGAPIDYDAIPGTPTAYEADHKQTRKARPDLWLIWNNIGASHVRCNRARQDTHIDILKPVAAQDNWVRPKW